MNVLIGVSDESILKGGKVSWRGSVLENIKLFFDLDQAYELSGEIGIAYFATSKNNTKNAYEIIVNSIHYDGQLLEVEFAPQEMLNVKSVDIRNRAQRFLRGRKVLPTDKYLPYFSIVNEAEFEKLKSNISLADELKLLTEKHDWQTIFQKNGAS
ncbi:MAG: hypothetical protein IPK08_19680 [Bacteroidetes bacterium]|nr:hypothetical protein [Bacteroidota bacterium]